VSRRSVSRLGRAAAALALLAALCGALPATAGAGEEVPADRQALILLRILAYDHDLEKRAGKVVTIVVVDDDDNRTSSDAGTAMAAALDACSDHATVAGLPIRVVRVAYVADTFAASLAAAGAAAVYLSPRLEAALPAIVAATRAHDALTFSGEANYLKHGIAIALVRRDQKVGIVVNRSAARAEGAILSSALLRIAEYVPEEP
jgi:hypothetical protein